MQSMDKDPNDSSAYSELSNQAVSGTNLEVISTITYSKSIQCSNIYNKQLLNFPGTYIRDEWSLAGSKPSIISSHDQNIKLKRNFCFTRVPNNQIIVVPNEFGQGGRFVTFDIVCNFASSLPTKKLLGTRVIGQCENGMRLVKMFFARKILVLLALVLNLRRARGISSFYMQLAMESALLCFGLVFSGQGPVLPFLRTDLMMGPPPQSLEPQQNSIAVPLDQQILVGNQTYETVYVSRVLFSKQCVCDANPLWLENVLATADLFDSLFKYKFNAALNLPKGNQKNSPLHLYMWPVCFNTAAGICARNGNEIGTRRFVVLLQISLVSARLVACVQYDPLCSLGPLQSFPK